MTRWRKTLSKKIVAEMEGNVCRERRVPEILSRLLDPAEPKGLLSQAFQLCKVINIIFDLSQFQLGFLSQDLRLPA